MPQKADGEPIEPPVSEPSANGASPAATAAPEPDEDPHAQREVSHGLRPGPWTERVDAAVEARELHQRELAEQRCAGGVQLLDRGRVVVEDLVAVRARAPDRRRAARGQQVLRAVGDPEQRPGPPGGELAVGRIGLLERAVAGERRQGVVASARSARAGRGSGRSARGRRPPGGRAAPAAR